MDSSIRMINTGSAFTESPIPIDSSTVITALGIRVGIEKVVGSGVICGVGVGARVAEGATVSSRDGVRADPGWAQAIATPNSRTISPRRRRDIIEVREQQLGMDGAIQSLRIIIGKRNWQYG